MQQRHPTRRAFLSRSTQQCSANILPQLPRCCSTGRAKTSLSPCSRIPTRSSYVLVSLQIQTRWSSTCARTLSRMVVHLLLLLMSRGRQTDIPLLSWHGLLVRTDHRRRPRHHQAGPPARLDAVPPSSAHLCRFPRSMGKEWPGGCLPVRKPALVCQVWNSPVL